MDFLKYLFYFSISNPALWAALVIPICMNTTVRLSLNGNLENPSQKNSDIMTWVDIAAQIASVVTLAMANIAALAILSFSNDNWGIHIVTAAVAIFHLFFIGGFRISRDHLESYRQRLGVNMPPLKSRITWARIVGFVIEIAIPSYVYIVVACLEDGSFIVPDSLPSLQGL